MTLIDARELRDVIRAAGVHCIVPLGNGPDGYKARIITDKGPVEFAASEEWDAYNAERLKRHPPGMIYWRVTIDTLLPAAMRTGTTVEGAVMSQHPVSEWVPLGEFWRLAEHLRTNHPVTNYGLLYGHQSRRVEGDDSGHAAFMESLKQNPAAAIMRIETERARVRDEAELAVKKFLADFPLMQYGLLAAVSGA